MTLLAGKSAVVTGASRGIGRVIAETFAAEGAAVVACVRAVTSDVETWAAALAETSGQAVTPVVLDLADEVSIKAAIKSVRDAAPSVDVLVNNAGVATGGLFQMMPMAELRQVFEVNVFGPIALAQGISRLMARHKKGSIVNIASTAAFIADPGTLAYGTSKAALARATQSMATELGAAGIRVNALAPGVTKTDMYDQMADDARDRLIGASALKRAAEPQDVANAALFLASDLSSHITGQVIRVDGGIV